MSSRTFKRMITIALIFLLLLILLFAVFSFIYFNRTTIYEGVSINGIDVSGLNRMEAMAKLRNSFAEALNNKILVLKYEDYQYSASFSDLNVQYDYYKAVNNGFKIGRKGNIFDRFTDIFDCKINGRNLTLELIYKKGKVDVLIEDIKKDLNVKSQDATIEYVNWNFKTAPEVVGRRVQEDLLKTRIIQGILYGKEIHIPVQAHTPKITEELLKKIQHPIAEFTTYFGASSEARKNNIKIASLKINGSVILPSNVFSFNESTGERSRNTGYMESKVIVDGKFVPDIGGGVCQVSTTLYNAILRGNFEIVERHHHSIPVSYVPKGEDATVSYGYLDLKFRNNFDFPIYIQAKASSSAVTFRIFGGEVDGNIKTKIVSILQEKVKPEIEKHVDNSLAPGATTIVQEGRYGYKVSTYRVIYEDGEEIKRELISNDFYKPKRYILRIGPGSTKESILQIENTGGKLVQ